jgi:hypothetical protein
LAPREALDFAAKLMGYRLDLPDGSPGVKAALAFLRSYMLENGIPVRN